MLVQEILTFSRVRESDIIKGNDRRWELADIFKVEVQGPWGLNLLYKTCGFHFVDDLLF